MKNRKIYFLCPQNKNATGGVKQIYKQVYFLKKNNFDVVLLLNKKSKTEKWINFDVPVEYAPEFFKKIKFINKNSENKFLSKLILKYLKMLSPKIEKDAILVFPEIFANATTHILPENPKVIFNQNCYYTFPASFDPNAKDNFPYLNGNVIATIVVSKDSYEYLKFTYPDQKIFRIKLGIDQEIFNYQEEKKDTITFMPRKLPEDINQVLHILHERENIRGWEFLGIDNKSEREVADLMKGSKIFLSFNHREGFGLPPLEAMSCGCFIVGYQGQGGREYFHPEYTNAIPEGEIVEYVKAVENAVNAFEESSEKMKYKSFEASEFVMKNYNLVTEEQDVVRIWNDILTN